MWIPILIGLFTGGISALCGVGGGIIMVPAFTLMLEMTQKQAVATSLAVITLPTALMATLKNSSEGLVNWKIALLTALGMSLSAYLGAIALKQLSDAWLTRIFAIFLIATGTRFLLWPPGDKANNPAPLEKEISKKTVNDP